MGEEFMKIKTVVSGIDVPAKLIYAKGVNETSSESGFPASAGSLSSVIIRLACVLLMCLLVSAGVLAQNTTASISGSVKDRYGEPIEAATIQITNNETGAFYGAVSNRYGIFSLSGLKPGKYLVKVSFVGYTGLGFDNVVLSVGKDYNLNVVLEEDTKNLPMVTIMGESTHFNETRTGQAYNINRESMNRLIAVKITQWRGVTDVVQPLPLTEP